MSRDDQQPPRIREDPDAEEIARSLAIRHKVDYVDLRSVVIRDCTIDAVPRSIAIENSIIPITSEGSALVVATSEPGDYEKLEKISFILNRAVGFTVAPKPYIEAAIRWYYPENEM